VTALPLALALVAAAATDPAAATTTASAAGPSAPAQGPDVELHVPRADVKKVSLDVENLQARLNVDTHVANLVSISAGVVATVQRLKVDLEDVQAETHLVVRLDRVAQVMSRALAAIEQRPDLAGNGGAALVVPAGNAEVAADAATGVTVPAAASTGAKP
jgi:hypothetical protein